MKDSSLRFAGVASITTRIFVLFTFLISVQPSVRAVQSDAIPEREYWLLSPAPVIVTGALRPASDGSHRPNSAWTMLLSNCCVVALPAIALAPESLQIFRQLSILSFAHNRSPPALPVPGR